MKTLFVIYCTGLGLLASAAYGQYNYGYPTAGEDTSHREVSQSKQFYHSKDLLGAKVNDGQGKKLGKIDDLVVNPKTGEVLAAIRIERGQNALVPLQALNFTAGRGMLGHLEAKIAKSKADLAAGPIVTNDDWQKLDDPSFTQRIYSFYNVQAPSGAMGGTKDEGGVSAGSSKHNR
jgi:hypothetical protein